MMETASTDSDDSASPAPPPPADRRQSFIDAIAEAPTTAAATVLIGRWILHEFDTYYAEYCGIADRAEAAFQTLDFQVSLALSKRRLAVYSTSIEEFSPHLNRLRPELAEQQALWEPIESSFLDLIKGRYEADLAFAYMHSVRRRLCFGEWRPVEYSFGRGSRLRDTRRSVVYRSFDLDGELSAAVAEEILTLPGFRRPFRDLSNDAAAVAERVNAALQSTTLSPLRRVEMITAGFYRNRGAYLVGRALCNDVYRPLIIALLNDADGIYADAVLTEAAAAHNLFSSTLANFHVTDMRYHELVDFLYSIMPLRPRGLHYSTIGFNHFGKVAVLSELKAELDAHSGSYRHAVGNRGTVAIGFAEPSSAYNLKVIRDTPTEHYKWGEFDGVSAVLQKYRRVHEINRTGSMLDNIIYTNIKLERARFESALLEELLEAAAGSVSLQGNDLIFKHLVVQRRMTPLPVFLQGATQQDAETAIVNLGYCIKNNAAANIFNKDLDARNYGVSRLLKVYLYDYDALEPFSDVKIRTNMGQVDGEEDVPDWFFEDGVIFLPEEIEAGLMLDDRQLRRRFRDVHGDLLTVDYWQRLQDDILGGRVPSIRTYPQSAEL